MMGLYHPFIARHVPTWTDASNDNQQTFQRCVQTCVQRTGKNSGWCSQHCMPPVTATVPSYRVAQAPVARYDSRFMQSYPMSTDVDSRRRLADLGIWRHEQF